MKFDKKNLKKFLIILTLIMFVVTIYKISSTYALLQSQTESVISKEIGKWNIKINENDITNGLSQEIVIDNFKMVTNSNVKDGKIAPGTSGTLDLILDPVDTDVSVRFDVSFNKISQAEQIKLISIEKVDGNTNLIKTAESTYSGVMGLSEITNKTAAVTIRIEIGWENDEANNEIDTKIGTAQTLDLEIPIEINVCQYLGEEIIEFNG